MSDGLARVRTRRAGAAALILGLLAVTGSIAAADEQGLWERDRLAGDLPARTALKDKGIDITLNYIAETFSVLTGGVRTGTTFEGRLDLVVDTDLAKLAGWTGARTQFRVFQIHDLNNRNAATLAGSIADPSNIDAVPTTRLFTAWFEQKFGEAGSIRIGQLAADDEFLVSNTAASLINGTFGWAALMAANLPSGGPAYPLATPGIRVQVNPVQNVSLIAAVFSGDPAGAHCNDNPQICNRYGTTFSFSGGAFFIGEAQYLVNQDKDSKGLATAYKLGAWFHSGNFADQHVGIDSGNGIVTLAATPTPDPFYHRGNWGAYAVADQMIWRDGAMSVSVFARAGFAPSDRNLVSWYADGGIGFRGLFAGRPDDSLTLGIAHSHIGASARALDADTFALNGAPYPLRNDEIVFELSYSAQLAPWWTLQPDLQYIVHPGGNVPNPNNPARTVGNAFLVGARTTIAF